MTGPLALSCADEAAWWDLSAGKETGTGTGIRQTAGRICHTELIRKSRVQIHNRETDKGERSQKPEARMTSFRSRVNLNMWSDSSCERMRLSGLGFGGGESRLQQHVLEAEFGLDAPQRANSWHTYYNGRQAGVTPRVPPASCPTLPVLSTRLLPPLMAEHFWKINEWMLPILSLLSLNKSNKTDVGIWA